MKVIRGGKKEPEWLHWSLECLRCFCLFELDSPQDPVKLVFDQRDRDFYQVPCPSCGAVCTAAARKRAECTCHELPSVKEKPGPQNVGPTCSLHPLGFGLP